MDLKDDGVWAHFSCDGKHFSTCLSGIRTARWFVEAFEKKQAMPTPAPEPQELDIYDAVGAVAAALAEPEQQTEPNKCPYTDDLMEQVLDALRISAKRSKETIGQYQKIKAFNLSLEELEIVKACEAAIAALEKYRSQNGR